MKYLILLTPFFLLSCTDTQVSAPVVEPKVIDTQTSTSSQEVVPTTIRDVQAPTDTVTPVVTGAIQVR